MRMRALFVLGALALALPALLCPAQAQVGGNVPFSVPTTSSGQVTIPGGGTGAATAKAALSNLFTSLTNAASISVNTFQFPLALSPNALSVNASAQWNHIRISQPAGDNNTYTVGASGIAAGYTFYMEALSGSDATSNLYGTIGLVTNDGPGTVAALYGRAHASAGSTGPSIAIKHGTDCAAGAVCYGQQQTDDTFTNGGTLTALYWATSNVPAQTLSSTYGILFDSLVSIGTSGFEMFAVGAGDYLTLKNAAGNANLYEVNNLGYVGVNSPSSTTFLFQAVQASDDSTHGAIIKNAGSTHNARLYVDGSGNTVLGADGTAAITTVPGSGNTTVAGNVVATGGIAAGGGHAAAVRNVNTCGAGPNPATGAYTAQTPVTTEFYFAEMFIPANVTVTGAAVYNSATISGNMKVGLFDSSGNLVATSASTAMSGTSTYQRVPFTAPITALGPATYYVGVFYDNATVRPNTLTAGSCGTGVKTGQNYATGFTAISVPTTFAPSVGPVASPY